jgi:SAM-dependent methyltransferase
MDTGEAVLTPAEIYDTLFVPALFQQWGPIVASKARIGPGDRVLDVACGTGVLACAAHDRTGPEGAVNGLDSNPGMLAVARRKNNAVSWQEGKAEALPYPDESFDAVVSQFGFMFFEDRATALREMMRVLRPGGRMAVAVFDRIEASPGYAALEKLLRKFFGDRPADALRAPFALGEPNRLLAICAEAGITNAVVEKEHGTVRFDSIQSMISTERACVWTLGGLLDGTQFELLSREAKTALQPFICSDGTIAFGIIALVVSAQKR